MNFAFNKTIKKPALAASSASGFSIVKKQNTIEKIECLEGNKIKVAGKIDEETAPLVIPLRQQDKITVQDRLDKVRSVKRLKHTSGKDKRHEAKVRNVDTKSKLPDARSSEEETLEQRAARELLKDIHKINVKEEEENNFDIPLNADELPLEGAQESTLSDYDAVPVEKFGLAMLRGMGMKNEPKKNSDLPDLGPTMRPKGLGLGAERRVAAIGGSGNQELKPGAKVKVVNGRHKGVYGKTINMSQPETLNFIKLVEARRLLWNRLDPDCRNKKKQQNAWKEISMQTNIPCAALVAKWRSLNGCFRLYLSKELKSKARAKHSGAIYKCVWFAYDAMSFLKCLRVTPSTVAMPETKRLLQDSASLSTLNEDVPTTIPESTREFIQEQSTEITDTIDSSNINPASSESFVVPPSTSYPSVQLQSATLPTVPITQNMFEIHKVESFNSSSNSTNHTTALSNADAAQFGHTVGDILKYTSAEKRQNLFGKIIETIVNCNTFDSDVIQYGQTVMHLLQNLDRTKRKAVYNEMVTLINTRDLYDSI